MLGQQVALDCPLIGQQQHHQRHEFATIDELDTSSSIQQATSEGVLNRHADDDRVELILWYKQPLSENEFKGHNSTSQTQIQQPIYSVDGRAIGQETNSRQVIDLIASEHAKHHSQVANSNMNLKFSLSHQNQQGDEGNKTDSIWLATLQLGPAKLEHSGLYKCRVDFRFARTRSQLIRLEVIGKQLANL